LCVPSDRGADPGRVPAAVPAAGADACRGDRRVPGPHDRAQHGRALRARAAALALDAARLAVLDHAGEPPPLPPRAQPRQLRPVLHVVGPLVRHRGRRLSARGRRALRRRRARRQSGMTRALLLALLAALAAPTAHAQPDIAGDWWTPGFNARVRIERCGAAVCGRIVWLWDDTPKDIA